MERFLVRNQVPKPDPGIANRAAKAKQHRKLEKLADSTLHKRRKLETRSAFLHDHVIKDPIVHREHEMEGIPYNTLSGGNQGEPRLRGTAIGRDYRAAGSVVRYHPKGDPHYGFMEVAAEQHAREAYVDDKSREIPAKEYKPPHVKYYRTTGKTGDKVRMWDEVSAGDHLRYKEYSKGLVDPMQTLAPGLVSQRLRAIERK